MPLSLSLSPFYFFAFVGKSLLADYVNTCSPKVVRPTNILVKLSLIPYFFSFAFLSYFLLQPSLGYLLPLIYDYFFSRSSHCCMYSCKDMCCAQMTQLGSTNHDGRFLNWCGVGCGCPCSGHYTFLILFLFWCVWEDRPDGAVIFILLLLEWWKWKGVLSESRPLGNQTSTPLTAFRHQPLLVVSRQAVEENSRMKIKV